MISIFPFNFHINHPIKSLQVYNTVYCQKIRFRIIILFIQ